MSVLSTAEATSGSPPSVQLGSAARPADPSAAAMPTQAGSHGVRFDFNFGARVVPPAGHWRVRPSDIDTGNILFEGESHGALVTSSKRWFVQFGIQVRDLGGGTDARPVPVHDHDTRGRDVLIHVPIGTLGGTLAWFACAARFAEERGCRLVCAMSDLIIRLITAGHVIRTIERAPCFAQHPSTDVSIDAATEAALP